MSKLCTKHLALIFFLFFSLAINAAPNVRSMIVFGESLSDTGNTTHLLKSLRFEESPAYLVRPFKVFVIHRMEDFADNYHVPQSLLDAGVEMVEDFFDQQLGPMLAMLVGEIRRAPLLPGEPYWQDRFSNGRVWPEYLAPMIGIDREDKRQFDIQAFAGSWAVTYDYQLTTWNLIRHPIETLKTLVSGKLIPPSLGLTVQAWFLINEGASSDDLFFVFSGSNDYVKILTFEDNYNPAVMDAYIENVLDGIGYNVDKLIQNGARQLVIINLPDISITPRFLHTTDQPVLALAVTKHNQRLKGRVSRWKVLYPDVKITLVDIQKIMKSIINKPLSYGFSNTLEPCIDVILPSIDLLGSPFVQNPSLNMAQVASYKDPSWRRDRRNYHRCEQEEKYMFWDEIHPTTKLHHWFAFKVCEVLQTQGYKTHCEKPA